MSRGCRFVSFALPLGLLCLAGCLLPYAYPNLSYVPGCELSTQMPDCHVFRVDVAAHEVDVGENGEYTLVEIPRRSDGSFPPQFGLSVDYGFYVAGIAVNYNVGWLHSTRVRLYRPGYQLIEQAPWDLTNKVQWQPATNWIEQEKAIDELIRCPAVSESEIAIRKHHNEEAPKRGSPTASDIISPKAAFLFTAAEYERVATLAPTPEDAARLRNKAKKLRTPRKPQTSEGSSLHDPH
jgi:hypothetical protein